MKTLEKRANENAVELLRDPETNLQIGCWYLQKLRQTYRGLPGEEARTLAAYNAGPSRVEEWSKPAVNDETGQPLSEQQFIERIDIPSTRSYVESILERYRKLKKPL
jgi:soluble lytic murein transglycosylase